MSAADRGKTFPCPGYLDGALRERWNALAPELERMGTLDALNADLAAKYILAENEYLRVSALVQGAISRGDGEESNRWLQAQDRLTKQILALGAELGLTAKARRSLGLPAPGSGRG